ncbi:tRNA 2-selenouridine(34) synthase MnmH [Clostridium sp. Sa3CUN1]|uniref:tRNA 2-selenouridine(34) synthase MnmH n=1 Tax=Clostridium gallinarum TaxID=2762246 RepID=A0ABR8Q7U4_9CLOT|nr:tRNA 2-selenouridine(34) synthase MnmH [Clostridium gallinarum]MBD7916503.1 tRNA 2-selenouridine(34) synthase MnmH [Clostridium gallinarum]
MLKKDNQTNEFKEIVLNNIPLIDVRAPIEYEKGGFLNSTNIPILNNEERHMIGICYKEKGNEEATKLGYKLVSGKIREDRINSWINFIETHKNTMIYCFRGGSRSRIAQEWISEALNKDILRLKGGYKAFRNYLIENLSIQNQNYKPIILTGYTGSGKTKILKNIDNSIDLEGIANHRGSSFGSHVSPQPTQINFENNLAYDLIKKQSKNFEYLIFEDEGKNIGKNFIPQEFYDFFHSGKKILVSSTIEERVENTLVEYVIDSQKEYINYYGIENGLAEWFNYIYSSMDRLKKKLGGDRFKKVLDELNFAYKTQLNSGKIDYHKYWIELFLKEYYDPMYSYTLQKDRNNKTIIFEGNSNEVLEYLKNLK